MPDQEAPQVQEEERAGSHLRGNLGTIAVMFMVLAAAAPLTVVGGIIPIGFLLGNGAGFPSMFLVATVILLLFAVGLIAMSREIPIAGAFFTYIGHGLGRIPGTGSAYLAMVCYSTIQMAVFIFFGTAIESMIVAAGGPNIRWWVISLVGIAAVAVLGYLNLELSSKVLIAVLTGEILVVLVLAAVILATGGADGINLSSFSLGAVLSQSPALGLMFAVSGFIGFESTVVYRREVREPDRTIPRATYGAAIAIGLFYTLAAWAMVLGVGIAGLSEVDPATLLTTITEDYLGPVGSVIVGVLLVGSMFAAVLSLHNVLTRYLHALGHARLLPGEIAKVHDRHGSPHRASLVQSTVSVVIIALVVLSGAAPEAVFARFAGVGTLAVILLMATTCLSVVIFFARRRTTIGVWSSRIAPALGFVGLTAAAVLIAANFPLLVGDADADGQPVWGSIAVAFVVVVIAAPCLGILHGCIVKWRRPDIYRHLVQRFSA
jgi:amino acid transporter